MCVVWQLVGPKIETAVLIESRSREGRREGTWSGETEDRGGDREGVEKSGGHT